MKTPFNLYSRTNQVILDGSCFAFSFIMAYVIRLEGLPTGSDLRQMVLWLPILIFARLAVNSKQGIYRQVWRFVSFADALEVAKSIAVVSATLTVLRFLVIVPGAFGEWIRIPLSIIALDGLFALTLSMGIRAFRRILYSNRRNATTASGQPPKRVLLYGAGRAGIMLRNELETNRTYEVVGFIDDDPEKVGSVISNTRVMGSGNEIERLVTRFRVDEIIISMATASRLTLTRTLAKCRRANVPATIIPSLREILTGQVQISQIRETRAEEVLGRESVEVLDFEQIASSTYRNKRILVTGAGGSIGSELVKQLIRLAPSSIAILDKDENSIYELDQELHQAKSSVSVEPHIADVRNAGRLRAIFSDFRPQLVFHAAAHKHVPLMESHPSEAVLNNVVGTQNILDVTAMFGAERFVFISSDKAVNPSNVMGATKRIGEMLVQAALNSHGGRFACVRFGNVLGSRGSVIPLFKKQIAQGGPVTITDPNIVRYFMTIKEAVQLIICAGTLAQGGEIFVLDMGNPRNILELAHEMILLAGLEPGKDIETRITGLRPGEKMMEELVGPSETLSRTSFEKLSIIKSQPRDAHSLMGDISRLVEIARMNDDRQVYEALHGMDLGFTPQVLKARVAAGSN